jgi:transcriptional regulator GlxA family with amidase domain
MGADMTNDAGAPYRVGFFLVPDFTMIAFASAVECLRLANWVMGREAYAWTMVSADGKPVKASNKLEIAAAGTLADCGPLDAVFVCGGQDVHGFDDRTVLAGLRRRVAHGATLGALCTCTHVLASAGLLDGYRCTIHWENMPAFVEAFPEVQATTELFAVDRNRYSCAGGTAALDLMLHLVSAHHGPEVAAAVSDELIHHRIRDGHEGQRMDLRTRSGIAHPKLLAVVAAMEENIEHPMSCSELAADVGLSTRQLERLFQTYLAVPPTRYYLRMRLERARFLLRQTSMPVFDVALATGFISASHFSKCYREQFGSPPSAERRRGVSADPPPPFETDADSAVLG